MTNTVIDVATTNASRLNVIPAFQTLFATIVTRQDTITELLPIANNNTKAYKAARDLQRNALATVCLAVCNPTRAYADSIGDDILLADMDWTLAELKKTKIEELEGIAQNIHDKAYAVRVAAAPFGLDEDMLTALDDQIPIWHNWVAAVRSRRVAIKVAKQDVVKNVKENERIFKTQLDYMVQTLSVSDPEMVALWTNARQVLDPPSTKTQALVTVQDKVTGLPVYEASVQIVLGSVTYTATTDAEGKALIKPIKKPGKYNVTVTAPDYQAYFKLEQRVYLGRINRLTVELVPAT